MQTDNRVEAHEGSRNVVNFAFSGSLPSLSPFSRFVSSYDIRVHRCSSVVESPSVAVCCQLLCVSPRLSACSALKSFCPHVSAFCLLRSAFVISAFPPGPFRPFGPFCPLCLPRFPSPSPRHSVTPLPSPLNPQLPNSQPFSLPVTRHLPTAPTSPYKTSANSSAAPHSCK